jgi:hypothetical protein|tara:strand:- start:210 stop:428 length:219 start_codon:yes stop_codon:yes gene_type:complete
MRIYLEWNKKEYRPLIPEVCGVINRMGEKTVYEEEATARRLCGESYRNIFTAANLRFAGCFISEAVDIASWG